MPLSLKKVTQYPKISVFLFCLLFNYSAKAQYFANVETGIVATGFNTIRNGENGTFFSLKDDFNSPASPYLRLRFGLLLNKKHHFSVLYAPLKLTLNSTLNQPILFNNKNFEANIPLEAVYQFNSYRFTYNRRIINTPKFDLGLGLTAKIRDAGNSLRNNTTFSGDFSTGFVPLINIITNWKVANKFSLSVFGEGIVAPKGRAIDVAFTGIYEISKNLQGNIGYRILDGGANGTNQYNFVQFHFAVLSFTYSFNTFK